MSEKIRINFPIFSLDLVEAAKRSESILSTLDEQTLINILDRYAKFWFLNKKYPDANHAPTYDIDEMWHLHMLHPKKYFDDCISYFGYILDHNAGFGKEESEKPTLINLYEASKQLWVTEFNGAYHEKISEVIATNLQDSYSRLQNIETRTCYSAPTASVEARTCYSAPTASVETRTCYSAPTASVEARTCYSAPTASVEARTCYSAPTASVEARTCYSAPTASVEARTCYSAPSNSERDREIVLV